MKKHFSENRKDRRRLREPSSFRIQTHESSKLDLFFASPPLFEIFNLGGGDGALGLFPSSADAELTMYV